LMFQATPVGKGFASLNEVRASGAACQRANDGTGRSGRRAPS
jgi:hypothetical protein